MGTRAKYQHGARVTVRGTHKEGELDGAWWPRTHVLSDELPELFASWSTTNGHITRVFYSPPDWDDRPRTVPVPRRRAPLRTGNLPSDVHRIVLLVMLDGTQWSLAVIPPDTEAEVAARRLDQVDVRS